MAASTATSSRATLYNFREYLLRNTRTRKKPGDLPHGVYAFIFEAEVPTTSTDEQNDEYRLGYFPDDYNIYLMDLQVTADDMDTHATPTAVFDVNLDDGSSEVTLINNSTVMQGGGSDELDADAGHVLRSVSGNWLVVKMVTAGATPAAGTVTLKGLVYVGTPITFSAA